MDEPFLHQNMEDDDDVALLIKPKIGSFESASSPSISRNQSAFRRFFKKKSAAAIAATQAHDAEAGGARLTLFDLLCIGIGGTIGSGVFVLTGDVVPKAGPSATLSWVVAGLVCLLSGFSYMELSARIPTAGSCYAFAYHTLGEGPAVLGAICLTMEYGLSGAGVARSWAAKLASLINAQSWMEVSYGTVPGDDADDGYDYYMDWGAAVIQLVCVVICYLGLDLGKSVINVFTVAKCCLVIFMIICGFCAARVNIFASPEVYFDHGLSGTFEGVSLLFFGFIGFDEVCCLAAKSENSAVTMPRAIAGTLIGAALMSMLAQLALAVMVIDNDSVTSFEDQFKDVGWPVVQWIVAVGEEILLPLVVLVCFIPQPELLAAMADDGIIPQVFAGRNSKGVFVMGCVISGTAMTLVSLCVPFAILWNMISLGVLIGFNLTNSSLIMLRLGNGGADFNPMATRLLGLFWITGAVSMYTLWIGVLSVSSPSTSCVVVTILFSVADVCLISALYRLNRRHEAQTPAQNNDDDDDGKIFRAPWVPVLPCLAMLVNLVLMASFTANDHIYFAAFTVVIFGFYFCYRAISPEVKDL